MSNFPAIAEFQNAEHVVLETKSAEVIEFPRLGNRDLEWLMRDVSSTPYGVVIGRKS